MCAATSQIRVTSASLHANDPVSVRSYSTCWNTGGSSRTSPSPPRMMSFAYRHPVIFVVTVSPAGIGQSSMWRRL